MVLKVTIIFLSDVDEENSCCTTEHGDDITGCDLCQHLRQTPVDKLTRSKETTDQGQTVTSTRSTAHVSPFSEIDKPPAETARITSCGKHKHLPIKLYLLLINAFKDIDTVSYRLSNFFPFDLWPKYQERRLYIQGAKNEDPQLTVCIEEDIFSVGVRWV